MFGRRYSKWAINQFFLYQKLTISVSVVILLMFSQSVYSAGAVLEAIRISSKGNDTIIDIDLGIELNYSKHFPYSAGEILQVQMSLDTNIDGDRTIRKEIRQGEDLKPPAGKEPILIYVTYEEGVPGGPYLTLRFARRVNFAVNAGDSARGLSVVVYGEAPKNELAGLDEQTAKDKKADKKSPAIIKSNNDTDVGQLMAKARQALTFGDNTGAITLLRRIIALPENEHTQDARELLGLGLERDRQIPRAKFEYKKYLRLYKKGDGPKRVKQRLIALQNIGIEKRKRLRVPTSRKRKKEDSFKVFGRLSQAYDQRWIQDVDSDEETAEDNTGFETVSKRVDTNLNVRGRYRSSKRAIQLVAAGNYFYDIAADDENEDIKKENDKDADKSNDKALEETGEGRLYDLYVDYNEIKPGFTATVGRQRARNTGLLARFDGAMLGYQVAATMKPYVYFGSPAFYGEVPYSKKFVGAKLDYGSRKSPLGGTVYFTLQEVNDLSDRQGVGGTLHYTSQSMSLFGMLDYDVLFEDITVANFRWSWRYSKKANMNLTFNYRNFLVKSNAVSGQTISIEELESLKGEEETLKIARDKTPRSVNVTLSNSYQFNRDLNLSVDASYYQTFASDGSFELNGIGKYGADNDPDTLDTDPVNDYFLTEEFKSIFLSTQLVSSNTFAQNDLYVVGLRFSTSDDSNVYGLFLNGRLPPMKKLNIRPRLNLEFRDFEDKIEKDGSTVPGGGSSRSAILPSMRIDYRLFRKWIIESELGYEWIYYNDRNIKDQNRALVRVGYHYTF